MTTVQTLLQRNKRPISRTKKVISAVLIALSVILILTSVFGFIVRGTASTAANLNAMRTSAVLHAASGGLVDNIASQANAAKLKELRARQDFRKMGMDEVKAICLEAENQARAEAEALYSGAESADTSGLVLKIDGMEEALTSFNALEAREKQTYADLYTDLYEKIADWTELTAAAQDDDALFAAMAERVPALKDAQNAHLKASFVRMARDMAAARQKASDAEQYNLLLSGLCAVVTDWTAFADREADADALWAGLTEAMPDLTQGERFRDELLTQARTRIDAAVKGEPIEPFVQAEETTVTESELTVNYAYFAETDTLAALHATSDAAYGELWDELVRLIPDLNGLNKKMQASIKTTLETVVYSGSLDFSSRYNIYAAQKAAKVLKGSDAFLMRVASLAVQILIAGIALILFTLVYIFWKPLSGKLGVPRTIITLFFIYLCLAAELYNINVPMMLGNVMERVGMYGVLVLAMLPGIQCGIGLNMGMTIGCISGLLATVIALQYNLTGFPALIFSCVIGALIAVPLGWAYSKLLNRMKGNEMTISTYVGFSFVSLMCIGWMLLPFNNPKIIWLLCGRGLRVTHSLLGSFAHLLDNFLAFDLFGADIPTGLLLFFLMCCGVMWLFSRSRTGIAMSAVGSNPRFAEASGISVNHMRTIGTVLSTMLAAIGIVIYSQAFGYAQLYTAPRQLGFIAASAILIGGATVSKAKVGHVIIGVFLFEGVLALGQQIANAAVAGGGLSEVMRIMISNGIILYALTQSGGASRE